MQSYSAQKKAQILLTMHARPSSASIILENKQGCALIVKANYKSYWTFPGGIIDEGENPKQAAIREVREEVGLTVAPESVVFAWIAARRSAVLDTYQFIFKAPLQSQVLDNVVLQASEIEDWRIVTKEEVLSGNIHYAQAIILWAHDNQQGYIEQNFDSSK